MFHSLHWTERFDAPTEPVFAGGALGVVEQGWRPLEVLAGTLEFERFRPLLTK